MAALGVLLAPQVLMGLGLIIHPVLVIVEGPVIHARVHSGVPEAPALPITARGMATKAKVEEVVEVGGKNLVPIQPVHHFKIAALARNLILALQPRTHKQQQPRT